MSDLHSSMVRLEIVIKKNINKAVGGFTFQYGQIRNKHKQYYLDL